MLFYVRIVIVQVFSHAVMEKSCGTSDVEFLTSIACDFVYSVSSYHKFVKTILTGNIDSVNL